MCKHTENRRKKLIYFGHNQTDMVITLNHIMVYCPKCNNHARVDSVFWAQDGMRVTYQCCGSKDYADMGYIDILQEIFLPKYKPGGRSWRG